MGEWADEVGDQRGIWDSSYELWAMSYGLCARRVG
jgi:hypothetical protein